VSDPKVCSVLQIGWLDCLCYFGDYDILFNWSVRPREVRPIQVEDFKKNVGKDNEG
jgi:hypothetical protein